MPNDVRHLPSAPRVVDGKLVKVETTVRPIWADSQIGASSDKQHGLTELLPPSRALVPAPVGAAPEHVRAWFDAAVQASEPVIDGTLASERNAADTYRRMAKADNTRRAYRAAVRAWCAWCARHGLPSLPASGQDVAAFPAGCPVPTDDVCVSETMAGITREAARKGVVPRKKVAATATILRRLLAPIPGDVRGLRDRAILLVGCAGALRRSRPGGNLFRPSGEDRARHPANPSRRPRASRRSQ